MHVITRLYLQQGDSIDAAITRLAAQLIGGHSVAIWRADGLYCTVSYDPDCLMPEYGPPHDTLSGAMEGQLGQDE